MKIYAVDFESLEDDVAISFKKIEADDGEEAIKKAKAMLKHSNEWECAGLDRMKDD